MMNGTLAVKKEISALEKSLVKEEWMSAVPYDKMSDEQKVLLADYEKRVKMLATEVRACERERGREGGRKGVCVCELFWAMGNNRSTVCDLQS